MMETKKIKVKSTTIYRYPSALLKDVENESEKPDGFKFHYLEYDERGEVLVDIKYDENTLMTEKHEFKYDEKGNKVEQVNYFENELAEKIIYEYCDGLLSREIISYPDGESTVIEFRYDGKKNIIEKTEKDAEGTIEGVEKYSYNEKQLIEKTKFDADQRTVERFTYTYNSNNELEEETEWQATDNRKLRTVYQGSKESGQRLVVTYDEKGKVIAKIKELYDDKQRLVEVTSDSFYSNDLHKYAYDEKNNVVEVEIYRNGTIYFKSSYKYGENDLNKYCTVLVGETGRYTDVFEHEF